MSVVPIGCANDTTTMYEENAILVYGDLSTGLSFPDPLVPNTPRLYSIKAGNPLRAGRIDRYNVSVSFLITVVTPSSNPRTLLRMSIGGIPYTVTLPPPYPPGPQTQPGNGSTSGPPNPTLCKAYTWVDASDGPQSIELSATGSCLTDAGNGLNVGIVWSALTGDTGVFEISNIVFNYTYAGPQ
jgi:hypothetical protein